MNNSDVDVDYVSSCAEEVALEGLDGITLSGLWLRLQDRSRFPLVIDEPCRRWLWTLIVPHPAIQFFQLPQPRGALVIGNRFETTEIITGVITKKEDNAEDIYPISIVKGANVQGSCATYQTRVNVTDEIRDAAFNLKMSLLEVEEKWGECLVLVSSQEERLRALLGPRADPQVVFHDMMYCVLERIGRSRGMGEVTSGRLSMTCICEPKTLFYMRNKLWKMNLITQQVFHHRVGTTRFRKCVLLHLTRFSNRRKSPLSLMLSQVYNMVDSKPNRCEVAQVVFDKLGLKDDAVKKFVKSHLNCLAEVILLPLREVFPNLPDEGCFYASGNERCVKMIRLLDHVTEANFDEKVSASEKCDFEEEDDSQEECGSAASSASPLDAGNQFLDKSLLRQSFELIEKSGSKGLYLRELVAFLGIRSMDFRLLHKGLLATNMVSQVPTYIGKQKAHRLISNRYCNETHVELVEECRRFLQVADISEKTEAPVAPFKSGFLNEVLDICCENQTTMQGTLNVRMVRRARRVLEMTKATKVIDSPNIIHAALVEDEASEGIGKVDKKTVLRVIYWLINDGLVKSMKTTLKFGTVEKKIHMICDTTVSVKDEVFQNALQIAKFKNFAIGSTEAKASVKKRAEKKEGPKPKMEYVARIGYTYGHEPKFLRMKTIHKFLCYLAFDYDGDPDKVTEEDRTAIETQLPDGYSVPTIYRGKVSWKTFVPPLPPHDDWPKRWVLLSDILLRLPLSIFVKIINVTFRVEGLMEYLEHPIKKHFLVSQIPTDMRNVLLFARKYIFNAHELATKLSYMGLLSFSPNVHKEKDQVFLYIHRNTTLKDTKSSKPGYMTISADDTYEVLVFTLDTLEDVDLFWQTLEDVCSRTPLGLFTAAMGQSVTVELPHKKQCLMECSRPKTMEQVTDDGRVPGDGLGAGGLDSSLFAHLRRNWLWINVDLTRKKTDGERKGGKMADANKENGAGPVSKKRLARLSDKKRTLTVHRQQKNSEAGIETATMDGKTVKVTRGRKRKASTDPKWKKTKKVRTVKRRALRRVRRPFHDEVDKEALRRMRNLRVTWADKEDSFLLLCKVASLLLDPIARTLFVSGSIIRDLLHQRWPQLSMNKTSHACQRRIRYMLLKPETMYNVSVFVGEAKQDEEIMELCNVPKPLRTNEEACRDVFLPVLTKLQDKFKVQASGLSTALELPSTMAELESKYSLMVSDKFVLKDSRHHDVKNVVDIHCSVAYTFLIGALSVDKDKCNWSYHLYRILQQYPDNLLRSVFAILRADFLVCVKKKMARAAKGFSLASIPYKLSLKFYRTFATLINDEIYTEASTLMGQIREDALAGCPGQGVPVHNDSHGGLATVFEACVAAKRITHTLYVADQVLVVDKEAFSKSREADEEWKAGLRDWQGVSQSEEGTMKEKDEEDKKEDGAVPQDSTMQMEPVTNASRFALYMLRQQMTAPPSTRHNLPELMTVQLCPVHCHVKQPTTPFVLPKNLVDSFEAQISRMIPSEIAPFEVFLQPMEDPHEVTALRNLYNMILQHKELGIKEPDLEGMFQSEEYEALHGRMKVLVDGHQVIRAGVTVPRYVAMVHGRPWILDTVRVSKEEKAEALEKTLFLSDDLPSTSAPPDALEGLEDKTVEMEESDTRSLRPRRNSIKDKRHDIQKDFGQMDRKVVRLIYRPWRKPDGTVNRQMLNQMLRGVAGQVMFNPGISLDNLCEKFLPALQPVQVMELVDMLVDVGCFHKCFLKIPPVVSAFSRPEKISVTDTKCGPNDAVFLEADVECIPKLTQLLRLHPWSKVSRGSEFEQEQCPEPTEEDVIT